MCFTFAYLCGTFVPYVPISIGLEEIFDVFTDYNSGVNIVGRVEENPKRL